jgi:saccharopine dehydrogenase-like NADP-dependent oxidoreductase
MNKPRPSVLVIGGSGVFGSHLCRRLARLGLFQIIVGGRSAKKSAALLAELNLIDLECRARFASVNRSVVTAAQLKELGSVALIDAAGPFQGNDYRLPEAAIEAGIHYIDLADARAFVGGIGALDEKAKAAGVAVLSGASSTPAISGAILRDLTAGWQSIDRIWVSIVPGSRGDVNSRRIDPPMPGRSVIEAILSWTGERVRVFDDGRWQTRYGWSGIRKVNLGSLGWRRASLAETPDLDVLVEDFQPRISARFHAGLELGLMHNGMRILSAMRCRGLLPRLTLLAGVMTRPAQFLGRFGTDTGGMVVEAEGLDANGHAVRAEAQLTATNGHGPVIPSLAAVALLKQIAEGKLTFRGASHAGRILKAEEIMCLVPDLSIRLTTETPPRGKPLFRQVLGNSFDMMPSATQKLHRGAPAIFGEGRADIEAPDNMTGRLISSLFRFPRPGKDVPVSVLVEQTETGERWLRRYPGRDMLSFMGNPGSNAQTLEERFGWLSFRMNIIAHADGLDMEMVSARCCALKLPKFVTPRITASERTDTSNRHLFDVSIRLPLIGRIVRYEGWLALS